MGNKIYIGIDPGSKGALAILSEAFEPEIIPFSPEDKGMPSSIIGKLEETT